MCERSLWRTISFVGVFCAVEAIASSAQTFSNLLNFDLTNGAYPNAVVQATVSLPLGVILKTVPQMVLILRQGWCKPDWRPDRRT